MNIQLHFTGGVDAGLSPVDCRVSLAEGTRMPNGQKVPGD